MPCLELLALVFFSWPLVKIWSSLKNCGIKKIMHLPLYFFTWILQRFGSWVDIFLSPAILEEDIILVFVKFLKFYFSVLDACDYIRLNQVVHPKKLVPISPPKQIDENFVKVNFLGLICQWNWRCLGKWVVILFESF